MITIDEARNVIEGETFDYGKNVVKFDGFKVLVFIERDELAESPMDTDEGFGTFYSFNTRHTNFLHPDKAKEIARENPNARFLSYFEHGQCRWMPCNSDKRMYGGDWQWDGVDVAGLWVPSEHSEPQDGMSAKDWYDADCAADCKIFTDWCNGEVYGYIVKLKAGGKTFRSDSCWGFHGTDWEYLIHEIRNAANRMIEKYINTELAELNAGQVGSM